MMISWMMRGSGERGKREVGLGLAAHSELCYCTFDFIFIFVSTKIRNLSCFQNKKQLFGYSQVSLKIEKCKLFLFSMGFKVVLVPRKLIFGKYFSHLQVFGAIEHVGKLSTNPKIIALIEKIGFCFHIA